MKIALAPVVELPCPSIRWAVGMDGDRACALPKGHRGGHDYSIKPKSGSSGWEDL